MQIDAKKLNERVLEMIPVHVDLVITDDDKRAACDLIGNDTYGKPVWTAETISENNRVVVSFAKHRILTALSAKPEAGESEVERLREALEIAASMVDTPIARRKLGIFGDDERLATIRTALKGPPPMTEQGTAELAAQVRAIINEHAEYMGGFDRGQVNFGRDAVVRMVEAALRAEREACAKVADDMPMVLFGEDCCTIYAEAIAAAIRNRGGDDGEGVGLS